MSIFSLSMGRDLGSTLPTHSFPTSLCDQKENSALRLIVQIKRKSVKCKY